MMTSDYCLTDALRNVDSEWNLQVGGKSIMPLFDDEDWDDDDDDDD